VDKALFREALRQWLDWLGTVHAGGGRRSAPLIDEAGTLYEAFAGAFGRYDGGHSDPTVNKLLGDERRCHDWPASIHAIVMDMPRHWRVCLLGAALEYSQTTIAQQLGLRQQLVSVMLGHARRTLLERLRVLARTGRELRGMGLGAGSAPARSGRCGTGGGG
jgi:hypothetical protein